MRASRLLSGLATAVATMLLVTATPSWAHDPETPGGRESARRFLADRQPTQNLARVSGALVTCSNGSASGYPCKNVDLLSVLPLANIGGGQGNDIWGWTDPSTGKEYALMGRTNGTAFVDISTPTSPVYLGNLPTHNRNSTWRDIKVYKNHAYIVADVAGHGLQVFDLTRLRAVTSPQTFTEDAYYSQFGKAHNIAINEETGFAYAVGSNTCSGGPHMVNIQSPKQPTNAGCVSSDGYTHDTQCVLYRGPDADYTGRELCFNSNEDTVTIVDVTTKSNPRQIARKGYTGSAYTHQGWLTEDQRYFLVDDEQDERRRGVNTQTYIFDVANLDAPVHTGTYTAPVAAIDHNQYIKGNYSYQANYRAGLRILDVSAVSSARLTEAGYFDIYPASNSAQFNGAWSVYPYFASGNVIVSGIEQGLFVLRPNLTGAPDPTPSPTTPAPGGFFENLDDYPITDLATVESPITVSGLAGNAPTALKVGVNITHTYRGDLVIDLVAPDGTAYRLKNSSGSDSGDNVVTTYTVDASAEVANGTWKLRVRDAYQADTGRIDSWNLQF